MGSRRFDVVLPEGRWGDAVRDDLLRKLDRDGLEAFFELKLKLERYGPEPAATLGLLDGRIELGAERLGTGRNRVVVGCERQPRSVTVLGLTGTPADRAQVTTLARRAYGLRNAPLAWL